MKEGSRQTSILRELYVAMNCWHSVTAVNGMRYLLKVEILGTRLLNCVHKATVSVFTLGLF